MLSIYVMKNYGVSKMREPKHILKLMDEVEEFVSYVREQIADDHLRDKLYKALCGILIMRKLMREKK